jgi:nitrate/nitrite-specific signal transduction histidine kinase
LPSSDKLLYTSVSQLFLFSWWLARHLLRPVASLQSVTKRIAQGQFDARAATISHDELGELALVIALKTGETPTGRSLFIIALYS